MRSYYLRPYLTTKLGLRGRIDLLAIAPDGTLILIELKRAAPEAAALRLLGGREPIKNQTASITITFGGRDAKGFPYLADLEHWFYGQDQCADNNGRATGVRKSTESLWPRSIHP